MGEWEHQIYRRIGPVTIRVSVLLGGTPENERETEACVTRCWNGSLLQDLVAETLKTRAAVPGWSTSWPAPAHPKSKIHYRVSMWSNEQIKPAWLAEPPNKLPPEARIAMHLIATLAQRRLALEARLKRDRFQDFTS